METEDFERRRRFYLNKMKFLDMWFNKVIRKYIRQSSPGCEEPIITLHCGKEDPWYVLHRLRVLLTYLMGNQVYSFSRDEVLSNIVRLYKLRLRLRPKGTK